MCRSSCQSFRIQAFWCNDAYAVIHHQIFHWRCIGQHCARHIDRRRGRPCGAPAFRSECRRRRCRALVLLLLLSRDTEPNSMKVLDKYCR